MNKFNKLYEKVVEDLPYDLTKDLKETLWQVLPGTGTSDKKYKKWVKSLKETKDKKGNPAFDLTLKDGTKFRAIKESKWRSYWVFEIDKKRFEEKQKNEFAGYLEDKLIDQLEKYEERIKTFDWYHEYSDDFRVWKTGKSVLSDIRRIYDSLNSSDRKKAFKTYNKFAPEQFQIEDFKEFDKNKGIVQI